MIMFFSQISFKKEEYEVRAQLLSQSLPDLKMYLPRIFVQLGFRPYYNHHTKRYRQQTMTQEEMIGRYIGHIQAKHFKIMRYYGFCPTVSARNSCRECMKPCRWRRGKKRSSRTSPCWWRNFCVLTRTNTFCVATDCASEVHGQADTLRSGGDTGTPDFSVILVSARRPAHPDQ